MSDVPLPSSFDGNKDFYDENRWQKFTRRLKEEPLIPLGCAGTCYALYCASQSIRAGDSVTTNRMFRYRIYGQAFTLVALVGGSYYYNADRMLRKDYVKLQTEKKAKEKNEAWIRELEARDREDKDWRERMGKVVGEREAEAQRRLRQMEEKKSEGGGGGGAITKAVKKLRGEGKKAEESVGEVKSEKKVEQAVGEAKAEKRVEDTSAKAIAAAKMPAKSG